MKNILRLTILSTVLLLFSACADLPIIGDLLDGDAEETEVIEADNQTEEQEEAPETAEESEENPEASDDLTEGEAADTPVAEPENQEEDPTAINDDESLERTEEDDETSRSISSENEQEAESKQGGVCAEEHDNSAFTEEVEDDFYLPECAALNDISKSSSQITAHFHVANAESKEIFSAYKDFAGDRYTSENQRLDSGKYDLTIDDDEIEFRIEQEEDGAYLRIKIFNK